MSLGSVIGGVAGAVIGFFVAGPAGAYYGAVLGFGIGYALDPIIPDAPNIGLPDPDKAVMSSEIGAPIADLAGTCKITGHLLAYGKERNVVTYTEVEGGKGGGGSSQQATGRKFYMTWQLGVCSGPVDTLYAIYKNDEAVWEGPLDCPATGGKETIAIEGVGSCDFYFGTDDQVANTAVGEITDSTLNSPLRGLCWALMDDCYIGTYNRTPTYKFMVKKIPEAFAAGTATIKTYFANPAHVMWYALATLGGLPTTWLNTADFTSVGATLATETRGVSVLFDKQGAVQSYLNSLNLHADNIIRYGADGTFHPKLIRDDYVLATIPSVDESVMTGEPTLTRKSWIDTVNEVKVQYTRLIELTGRIDITNEYVEVLRTGAPEARLTNEYVEVLKEGLPNARLTNEYVEVLQAI